MSVFSEAVLTIFVSLKLERYSAFLLKGREGHRAMSGSDKNTKIINYKEVMKVNLLNIVDVFIDFMQRTITPVSLVANQEGVWY